jgi:hypothetical protein
MFVPIITGLISSKTQQMETLNFFFCCFLFNFRFKSDAACVEHTKAFQKLRDIYESETEIVLWDFDGYDHIKAGKTLKQALNDPSIIMGHAFVLAMLLTNQRHWLDQD